MLSFHQLDAVLMLLKGKFMQIAIILLQHSRNRRFASIICWFRALLKPALRKSRLSITFFTDLEDLSTIPQNNLTENMKNWTDRFPRLSRLNQGLKGRIETNSNIIFFKKNSLFFGPDPHGILRCVDRCWPSVRQALRSETPRTSRTCSMHRRRREGLSSFPLRPR